MFATGSMSLLGLYQPPVKAVCVRPGLARGMSALNNPRTAFQTLTQELGSALPPRSSAWWERRNNYCLQLSSLPTFNVY